MTSLLDGLLPRGSAHVRNGRHWLAHKLHLNMGSMVFATRNGRMLVLHVCSTCSHQRVLRDITEEVRQG